MNKHFPTLLYSIMNEKVKTSMCNYPKQKNKQKQKTLASSPPGLQLNKASLFNDVKFQRYWNFFRNLNITHKMEKPKNRQSN